MKSDLISRESVLKLIEDIKVNPDIQKNYGTLLDIMREVRKIPTAYDVDKVVGEIRRIPHGTTLNVELEEEIVGIIESRGIN